MGSAPGFSVIALASLLLSAFHAANAADTVLIYAPSVTGGLSSPEASAVTALGFNVDLVDDARFKNLTTTDFAAYRALVFGDPNCRDPDFYAAVAENRSSVWIQAVTGNVVIIGSDPGYHAKSFPGAVTLINDGINFVTSTPGKTGAYVCLSCNQKDGPVPWLDPFGGTWATAPTDCRSEVTILATSPALNGLSGADLSGWSCSTHEVFTSFNNATFKPLAQTDTEVLPYIVARGESLVPVAPPPPGNNPPPPIATTPQPNAPPPSFDLTESPCGDRCDVYGPQPNRCCNAEGTLGVCCPGQCGFTIDRPGGPPGTTMATCLGIAPSTPAPTTPAPTTPAPTTPAPTTPAPTTPLSACGDRCNPLSALPNRCCNAEGSLGICCPGRCGPSIFNADGTSKPTCQ